MQIEDPDQSIERPGVYSYSNCNQQNGHLSMLGKDVLQRFCFAVQNAIAKDLGTEIAFLVKKLYLTLLGDNLGTKQLLDVNSIETKYSIELITFQTYKITVLTEIYRIC